MFGVLDDMGLGSEKENVKSWYDGFTFGSYTDIYNPWSITSFIKKRGKYGASRLSFINLDTVQMQFGACCWRQDI